MASEKLTDLVPAPTLGPNDITYIVPTSGTFSGSTEYQATIAQIIALVSGTGGGQNILAGTGIDVTTSGLNDTVTITNLSGGFPNLTNAISSGDLVSGAYQVSAGNGLSIAYNGPNSITITNLSGGFPNLTNAISSGDLVSGAYQVSAGAGLSIAYNGPNSITITNLSGGFPNLTNAISSGDLVSGAYQVSAGNGLSIAYNGPNSITLANTSGALNIFAGQGITIGTSGGNSSITITNASGNNTSGGLNILAGTGIGVTTSGLNDTVTITNLSGGFPNLTNAISSGDLVSGAYQVSAGAGLSVVYNGPNSITLANTSGGLNILAGTGIGVTTSGLNDTVTITNTSGAGGGGGLTSGGVTSGYLATSSGQQAVISGTIASGAFEVTGTNITVTQTAANVFNVNASGIVEGTGGVQIVQGLPNIVNAMPFNQYTTAAANIQTIALGADGLVYAPVNLANSIFLESTSGTQSIISGAAGAQYLGLCQGSDGNIWVCDENRGALVKVTSGGATITAYLSGTLSFPHYVCNGPDGNLWVTANATVYKISTAGALIATYTPGQSHAKKICAASDGNLYTTDNVSGAIWRITTAGTGINIATISGSAPFAIVQGPDLNLWATDSVNGQLIRVTYSGTATLFNTSGVSATGICVGPDDNLWIAGQGNGYLRVTPFGQMTPLTGSALNPFDLCVGADRNIWGAAEIFGFNQVLSENLMVSSGNVYSGTLAATHFSSGTIVAGAGITVSQTASAITITNASGAGGLTSGEVTSGILGSGAVNIAAGAGVGVTLTGNNTWTVANLSNNPGICNCRLTLTSATPITTSDVTASTTLYLDPYLGDQIWIYSSTGGWYAYSFSELSIASQTTRTCTIVSSTSTFTLTSGNTNQLVRGMVVTGTGVTGTVIIATIPSSTTFTTSGGSLTNESSGQTITFKLPASSVFDVYLTTVGGGSSGTPTLQWAPAWTSATARQSAVAITQLNGVYVNNATINSADNNTIAANCGTLVGTVYVGTTAGQLNDAGGAGTTQVGGQRFVCNVYNRVKRHMSVVDLTSSWTYGSSTWHQADAATGNKCEYVSSVPSESIKAHSRSTGNVGGANDNIATGVGIDSTSTNSAQWFGSNQPSGNAILVDGEYVGNPGIGYHAVNWLENAAAGTASFFSNTVSIQSGMTVEVYC